jgi:hypothetical protein
MEHKPQKCKEGRAYAHHWDVDRQTGKYVWGTCRHCKRRRMFRNSWPDAADWPKERETRLKEEQKAKRRERRQRQV